MSEWENFQLAIGTFLLTIWKSIRVACGLPASPLEEMYRQLAGDLQSSMPRLGRLAESIEIDGTVLYQSPYIPDPNKSPLGQELDARAWQNQQLMLSDEVQLFSDTLAMIASAGKITLNAKHDAIEPYTPQPEYETDALFASPEWKERRN